MKVTNAKAVLMCSIAVLVCAAPLAAADVEDQLKALRGTVAAQQQEINSLKAQAAVAEGETNGDMMNGQRQMIASMVKSEVAKITQNWGWVSRFTVNGDFQYQFDHIRADVQGDNMNGTRNSQHRYRFRLFVGAEVTDEFSVGARLATSNNMNPAVAGDQNPSSNYQTATNWFGSKPIWIDWAYMQYEPNWMPGITVWAGKMPNPFYTPSISDLIWDPDVAPEGIAISHEMKCSDEWTVWINTGAFEMSERGAGQPDAKLWALQLVNKLAMPMLAEGAYVVGGLSYFDFVHVENEITPFPAPANGNITMADAGANDRYVSDFNILNPFVEFGMPIMDVPVVFFVDFAINMGATSSPNGVETDNNDFGTMFGVTIGQLRNPGDWEFGYDYVCLQPDATLGAFNGSERFRYQANTPGAIGGTDGTGHRFRGRYALDNNVTLGSTLYCDDANQFSLGSGNPYFLRWQFDVLVNF